MAYTGSWPATPKDIHAHNEAEIKKQNGFKGSKDVGQPWKAMTDDTAMDAFPAFKSNQDGTSGRGGASVKAGKSDLPIPKKNRPFGNYVGNTKPPLGRALPVRGEHND